MSSFVVELPDVVVPLATPSSSPWQSTKLTHSDAVALIIAAPASAEASVIEVSWDGVTPYALQNKTVAVAGPAATKAEVYGVGCPNPPIIAPYWRITMPVAAAQRTFKVAKQMSLTGP